MDPRLVAALDEREGQFSAMLKERGVGAALVEDSATLRRFLVARQLNLDAAFTMIEAHSKWREQNLPITLTPALRAELRKGKSYLRGNDAKGRPLFIIRSGRFDPKVRDLETAMKATVHTVEAAVAALPAEGSGPQQFAVMYDRTGFSLRENFDKDLILGCIQTLSNNYPERMGAVYLYPCGMVLSGLYRMISPFLDARMRAKVKMVTSDKELCSLVPPEYVPTWYGGQDTFEFDPSIYDE